MGNNFRRRNIKKKSIEKLLNCKIFFTKNIIETDKELTE
jgi:hypothetical protein